MAYNILTPYAASISELKKNPMATVEHGKGEPIAILNRNQPVFYCIPAKSFEMMIELLEEAEVITKNKD